MTERERELLKADEFLDRAVRACHENGEVSIRLVKRKLRVGYARAIRLVDVMDALEIVEPKELSAFHRRIDMAKYESLLLEAAQAEE